MQFEKKRSIYKTIMVFIVTALVTFLCTSILFYNYYIKTDNGNIKALSKCIVVSNSNSILQNKIEILKKYLENKYIGELNEDQMIQGALKGYVNALGDKYTEYLTKEELEELMINVNGNYVGIGIYMTQNDEKDVLILLPLEGSPAEEAGLKNGDIIVKVDGIECNGLDLSEVSNMIKGEEGTKVNLEILRDNQTFSIDVTRKMVELKYIDSKLLDNNIGYIQMVSFDEGAAVKIRAEIDKLKAQGAKSIILDMRDNGGGLVKEAIETAEIFVPMGKTILKSYDKEGKETVTKSTAIKNEDIKFVLLVNNNSASATEIFAAAIQDNNLGTIIGTTTYGKGVMQEIQPLEIGGALKMTIEEFKTPNGNKIHEVGITPDIEVENDKEDTQKDKQLETAIDYLSK